MRSSELLVAVSYASAPAGPRKHSALALQALRLEQRLGGEFADLRTPAYAQEQLIAA